MKNPLIPIRQRLVSYLSRNTIVPNLEDVQYNNGELLVDLASDDSVQYPNRNNLVSLATWVECEGFLFFDSLLIPHPAGFKAGEQKLFPYVQMLNGMFDSLQQVDKMLDYSISTLSTILNDPSKSESLSFKSEIKSLHQSFDNKTISQLADQYKPFFHGNKSSDRAPFADLFNNASELTRTANELGYLNDRIDGLTYAKKINAKVERLAELCINLTEEYPDYPHRTTLVSHIVSPMAYWCEFLAAYLYNVNVVNVCFKEIEEKLDKVKKEK